MVLAACSARPVRRSARTATCGRATTSAIYLLVNSLLGIGGGIYGIGRLSDALVPTLATESLRYAFAANAVGCVVGAACFYLASRRLARDWID